MGSQGLSGSITTLMAAGSLAATAKASATFEIGKRWVISFFPFPYKLFSMNRMYAQTSS